MSAREFLLMVLFLLLCATLSARQARADDWSRGDTIREATFIGLTYMDWSTTRQFAAKGCDHSSPITCDQQPVIPEVNPFLPARPNPSQINRVVIGGVVAHLAVSFLLKDEFLRQAFQYGSIAIEASYVKNNYSLGFRAKF